MSAFSMTDATILVADHDFSGDSNQATLSGEAEALESTTFRSGGHRARVAGLKTSQLDVAGFWSPTPDAKTFDGLNTGATKVVTVSPTNAEAATAFMFRAKYFNYSQFGDVGSIAPFNMTLMNTNREGLIRGTLLKRATTAAGVDQTVNATGATGTPFQLGAVQAGKFLYASFHVLSAGTTITAVVESAAASNFSGATTRATFGPITTTGGTWGTRVPGSITDTWYRIRVSAITGTFKIACAVGIG